MLVFLSLVLVSFFIILNFFFSFTLCNGEVERKHELHIEQNIPLENKEKFLFAFLYSNHHCQPTLNYHTLVKKPAARTSAGHRNNRNGS